MTSGRRGLEEQLRKTIAEHEEARREAARQRTLLEQVIDNVPHSIFWKDRQSVYLGANRKKLRALGLTSIDQLVGKTDFDTCVSQEDAAFYRKTDREVMEEGLQLVNIEEMQLRPDGPHVLLTSKVPLRDETGAVSGILGMYVDITDRKRMETELARAKEVAEEEVRTRGRFLAAITHELRTPLTLIVGPIEDVLAERQDLPYPVRRALERVRRNACRLAGLVDDVLDLSRIDEGKMDVYWEPADIAEAIADVVEDASSVAENKGIHLTFTAEPGIGLVQTDRAKVQTMVLELVGNALKCTPSAGRIDVEVRARDAEIEVSVADTGPGVPPERQGLIFQRFQQLSDWPNRRPGSGLGLALVKDLAELMGGSAGFEPPPNRGARFWVRLPRGHERLAPAPPEPHPRATPDTRFARIATLFTEANAPAPERIAVAAPVGSRPQILIAEDDADTATYMRDILSVGYAVTVVNNGGDALAIARDKQPCVILSDVTMPGMNGLELVKALKAEPGLRHIPVILVTARASRDAVVTGLECGADDYVAKPFGVAELRARVRAAERQREMFDALASKHRELEEAHERLRTTRDELIQVAKMAAVGTLAAGVSHELNNPLATILLAAQGLRRKLPADSPWLTSVDLIERHADRSGRLVRSLLDLSRRKSPEMEAVAVDELVGRVADLARSQVRGSNVALEVECPDAELPRVHANVQELEVSLLNLVKNALDASGDAGKVRLAVRREQHDGVAGVEIAVSDTGSGIPPDVLPQIFDPFFTTKAPGQGTGLGLSLARRIIDVHGGSMDVTSQTGAGTTMRVWLPAGTAPRRELPRSG
jgi:PAS domain S-box-containing protein